MFVIFVTATNVYYIQDTNHKFALYIAILYGLDIISVVWYFIGCQFGKIHFSNTITIYDKCLLYNLLLTSVSLLLFVINAMYIADQNWWLQGVFIIVLLSNVLIGLIPGGYAVKAWSDK